MNISSFNGLSNTAAYTGRASLPAEAAASSVTVQQASGGEQLMVGADSVQTSYDPSTDPTTEISFSPVCAAPNAEATALPVAASLAGPTGTALAQSLPPSPFKIPNPGAAVAQATIQAVTEAATEAVKNAPAGGNQKIEINIGDVNVFVFGFDDVLEATQDITTGAPPAAEGAGKEKKTRRPSGDEDGGSGGKEVRKVEIQKGDMVFRASETITPVPAAKASKPRK